MTYYGTLPNVAQELEDYTAKISRFELKRSYLSLSHISLDDDEILSQWFNGFKDSHLTRLRCYKGYQMERDLINRVIALYGDTNVKLNVEVKAGSLWKGHVEMLLHDIPTDCKSVPLDAHLPIDRVPRKVFMQMQAYMLYGKWDLGRVIYESRESGVIREYMLQPVTSVQAQIEAKRKRVESQIPCVS
jgi:hypothetical protein